MPIIESFKEHIFNPVVGFLFVIALVVFFWGVIQYLLDTDKEIKKGVDNIIYGLLGMAIMFSVFGIMTVISETIKSIAQ